MRIPGAELKKKKDYARKVIAGAGNGYTKAQIQHAIKERFGSKLSDRNITELIGEAKKKVRQNIASLSTGMQAAGRNSRLHETRQLEDPSVSATRQDLTVERDMQDIAKIIMKRQPGIRLFVLQVEDDGKVNLNYKLSKVLEGRVKF